MQFPPIPQAGTIHLQPVRLASAEDAEPGSPLLSAVEAGRAARFRDACDRARFMVGRVLARAVIGAATNTAPRDVALEIGPRGKPASPGLNFSLAHAGRWVVMAWSLDTPVGTDIEESAARVGASDAVYRKALHPNEQARAAAMPQDERDIFMTRAWVMKEAIAKATGDGLSLPFTDLELDLAQGGARFHGAAASRAGAWRLFERRIEGAYCAVAVMSETRPALLLHEYIDTRALMQTITQ